MTNPENSTHCSFFWLFLALKCVNLLLHFIISFDYLVFCSISEYNDIFETKGYLKHVRGISAVLGSILPWQVLSIVCDCCINKDKTESMGCNVVAVKHLHWFDTI